MPRVDRFGLYCHGVTTPASAPIRSCPVSPPLVRPGFSRDTARAAYVGDVLGNFDKVLHLHHEGEGQFGTRSSRQGRRLVRCT